MAEEPAARACQALSRDFAGAEASKTLRLLGASARSPQQTPEKESPIFCYGAESARSQIFRLLASCFFFFFFGKKKNMLGVLG